MRDDARVRPSRGLARILGATTLILAWAGCSGAERRHHRPLHDDDFDGSTARPATPARRPFPGLAALTAMPSIGQLKTVHPIGDLEATLRTNEGASGYGKRGRGPMPEGAIIIESLSAEPGSAALTHYVMRRRSQTLLTPASVGMRPTPNRLAGQAR